MMIRVVCIVAVVILFPRCRGNKSILVQYPRDAKGTDAAALFAPGIISAISFEHSAPADLC
jgi:hypothetical protein